jgi:hypothetical protein
MSIVNGLEKIYGDRINFVRANILFPENQPLMAEYGFSTTPEFYLVDPQGKIIGFWNDTVEAAVLRRFFDDALAAQNSSN